MNNWRVGWATAIAWIWSMGFGWGATNATPQVTHPLDFRVIERATRDGISLSVASEFNLEFTVTLDLVLTNAVASCPLPLTVDSAGRKSFELLNLHPKNPGLWKYSYTFYCQPGARRASRSNDAVYQLPYQLEQAHRVLQGNLGKFSHAAGSRNEYAVDWAAAPGTTICAARAGMVTGVRQDFTLGGPEEKYKAAANYVIIKHPDGTFAEYYHLQAKGALVQLGQKVSTGQAIALSGNTGFSARPHIHMAVFQNVDGKDRMTLPTRFRTSQGLMTDLEQGERY